METPITGFANKGTDSTAARKGRGAVGNVNMTMRMLIDATHAEETRVVILNGNRLESFDIESATKKQLKGNVYLAKVTRVEPSLQAAFVDYGGGRQGFLAFNEIHPDYYQIPVEDRRALLEEEAQQAVEDAALDDQAAADLSNTPTQDVDPTDETEDAVEGEDEAEDEAKAVGGESNGDDALDEVPRPRVRPKRNYKIQEVIKRRQILLVQVVKEEHGNKGAALTTYISMAGRYCVLMPNTARGGGISRKIVNQTARRKLKTIVSELDLPEGMGVIVRTAGMARTKTEIKRDFEYLIKLWDEVRESTLQSTAPTLVYEEANLVKRTIRDLYSKEIDEIFVEGEAGYRTAKDFMRSMQPSHAKKVQQHRGSIPLFHRYQVEQQLDQMHSNTVQLKSGGYIVLSPTEALVAIDVNSGRSTKEKNIEETALKTNLEASDEVARQLRLRDLAGLIVIDYIDMSENKHSRQVERRLKESLKVDRARIQVGRISSFGLLEMSRQRLRPSLVETSSVLCEICAGTGFVRSTESTVLHVLRAIEEEGIRERAGQITVNVPQAVALYILNQKRDALNEIEQRYDMGVLIYDDASLIPPDFRIEMDQTRAERLAERGTEEPEASQSQAVAEGEGEGEAVAEDESETQEVEAKETETKKPRRRRRRRKRGEEEVVATEASSEEAETEAEAVAEAEESPVEAAADSTEAGEENGGRRRRRRGRRGGRRRRGAAEGEETSESATQEAVGEATDVDAQVAEDEVGATPAETIEIEVPEAADAPETDAPIEAEPETPIEPEVVTPWQPPMAEDEAPLGDTAEGEEAEPEDGEIAPEEPEAVVAETPETEPIAPFPAPEAPEPEAPEQPESSETETPPAPKRRGWWQSRTG